MKPKHPISRAALVVVALAIALAAPVTAQAAWYDPRDWKSPSLPESVDKPLGYAFDIVVLRPVAAARLVVGSVMFVPAVIFSAADGKRAREDAWRVFVEEAYEDLTKRELNQF